MNKLVDFLQKNVFVILVMFVVSVLGGVITIILGWKQFYNDYLSKEIVIPVWLTILIIVVAGIIFLFKSSKKIPEEKDLETIEGVDFGVQQVILDGKRFVNCTFDGTELVFKGTQYFALEKNHFKSPPRIKFEYCAGITLNVLMALDKSPEFKEYVRSAFKQND
ncbi:MAG: hypothetical protein WCC10_01395 [Tumebacillaceae bacterium]